jgi:hypothetical protein
LTVIYGVDSFLTTLDQVLGQMVRYNVRLKPSKCSFGMERIEFLFILGCSPVLEQIEGHSSIPIGPRMPARVIIGDLAKSDLVMDLPQDWADRSVADYLVRVREAQVILIRKTRDFLDLNQKKQKRTGGAIIPEGVSFKEG